MQYYCILIVIGNEVQIQATTWMNLENIMLRAISLAQKVTPSVEIDQSRLNAET